MADKRISQLVERVTLLNNDVFPIVASGAATTNKVTLQTIDDYMQTNLNFGVTSVAMTVPTGLSVTGTPITSTGTFIITFTAGYSIPTTAKQTQWDTAYNNRIVSVTAPITFASNVLGITQSGAASDGYLSSTDWNTFNNKQAALTFGNLTEATSSVLTITGGTGAVIGSGTTIQVTQANGSQDGFLDSADWTTFNGKQNALTGTGIVKSTGGTITYLTDNTSNWDSAYNDKINSAAVTGTTTKTLTLTQQDGGTITTTWTDLDTGTVTSVGVSMPSAFSVANSPITSSGTIAITGAGLISQYIDGTGALQTFPSGLPPTGAAGGDLQGTYPNPTVHKIHGIDLQSGTPTTNDVWVYGGSPAKWQHQILHSNQVTEDGNLFYTDARARASISESVTGLDYNSTTGVISTSAGYGIPTTASQTTWDAAYNDKINSAAVTGTTTKTLTLNQQDGGTITASWTDDNTDAVTSVFGRTGAVIATEGDYSLTQLSDVTITTPSNGQFLKYDGASWINAAAGTVTSVALATGTTGTDVGVTGSPITGAGTITLNIPVASATNTGKLSSTDWSTFNGKQNAITLTTTGTSGAATLVGATLNIPNYSFAETDTLASVTGRGSTTSTKSTFSNGIIVSGSYQFGNTYGYSEYSINLSNSVPDTQDWVKLGTVSPYSLVKIYYRTGNSSAEETGEIRISSTCTQPFIEWSRNTYNPMCREVRARMTGGCGSCEIFVLVQHGSSYTGANTYFTWQVHDGNDSNFIASNTTATPGTGTNQVSINTTDGYFYRSTGNIGIQGTITASNFSGSSSGTNTGDQTLSGLGGVPTSRTITINGTAYDLSANRSWSVGTVVGNSNILSDANGSNVTINGGYYTGFNPTNIPAGQSSGDWGVSTFPIWTGNSATERYCVQFAANLDAASSIFVRKFFFLNGVSQQAWYTLLHSGNYSSYALPISGGTLTGALTTQVNDTGVGTKTIVHTIERTGAAPGSAREVGLVFKDGNNPTIVGGITGIRNNSAGNFIGGLKFYVMNTVSTPATSFSDLSLVLEMSYDRSSNFAANVASSGGFEIPNGEYYKARRTSGNLLTNMIGIPSGTDNVRIVSTGEWHFTNGSNIDVCKISNTGQMFLRPANNGTTSTIEFGSTDNAVISAYYSLNFNIDNTNTVGGRTINFQRGGKGYSGNPYTMMSINGDNGHVTPGNNGTQNLGSTSLRWATVFTSDLDMSNGIGDYTIVEGYEDLFLYNNNTGKVYKFNITEVDKSKAPAKKNSDGR